MQISSDNPADDSRLSADSLTSQTRRLIGSRPWNCEFLRARAGLSASTVAQLERIGDLRGAQTYVDAVMADVLLDLRIGVDRQLQMVILPYRTTSETLSGD